MICVEFGYKGLHGTLHFEHLLLFQAVRRFFGLLFGFNVVGLLQIGCRPGTLLAESPEQGRCVAERFVNVHALPPHLLIEPVPAQLLGLAIGPDQRSVSAPILVRGHA